MNIAVKVPTAETVAEINATPLEKLNPARVDRFYDDTIWPVFERLRREDPIHFTPESEYGPYWSITKWNDIMAVDTDHESFSSADGIALFNLEHRAEQEKVMGERRRNSAGFITMDEPEHSVARKAVSPTVAPSNLHTMAPQVRERAGQILDSLPIGKEFDWVDLVSKELTAMTLATLFDFPFEQRRKLPWWSDMIMNQPGHGPVESWEQKGAAMMECFSAFNELWNQRVNGPPGNDLISMLAHNPATRGMPMETYQGNVILLIVGGNDTTRNTISSSVFSLNRNPDQYAKLRANPDLVLPMVSETIRWQTPLAHMARVATRDVEMGGKTIKKGDRVAMWYISGNRDEEMIERPNDFIIDRERPRQHMSFGFGVHRCVGNRVAEMQLTIIWEEILKRFPEIKVVGEPVLNWSAFVHGFESLPVIIPTRN
ncbi:MAG: cytochrome P450 [Phenylobacterium sp.]|uniref:cytochrome P450 n=1 Tax=Phenylobacterium sp. TaxID=1871053 RepID=UPI001A3833A2|nr:cytochrome P450 [Phenylobacterium sp.]MBL8553624.1 cytochrome P450 [Phenylobacterium sp.]